ncbi:hypothetical protein [Rhizobium sp. R634]|uniref:hypothetical protein n=1 Tax=Rhizobium sp. R634 TaxID=1764274 RepID=UPI00167EDA8B|nr:hypothetical protein [Rhizobium sp. R634]
MRGRDAALLIGAAGARIGLGGTFARLAAAAHIDRRLTLVVYIGYRQLVVLGVLIQ